MTSHVGLSMWENDFCQPVFELLKKAGVKFLSSMPTPKAELPVPKRAIRTSKDLLRQKLYPEKTVFYPFVDYVLFVAGAENPLNEVANRSFRRFQVSVDSMQKIKAVTESLLQAEQEYMGSSFLQMELDERRRRLVNTWYSFFGYQTYQNSDETKMIFRASLNELHLLDMVYLKASRIEAIPDLHPESIFFCSLVLESARQLKKEPLAGEEMLLYQKAIKIYEEKKNAKRIKKASNADHSEKQKAAQPVKSDKSPEITTRFKAEKHTLYVYQGRIKCIKEHHPIICVTANIPTVGNTVAVLNVNLCRKCHRFYISYDEYTRYLEKYKSLLTRIVLANGNGSELFSGNFAEASPLKLCGYSVSQNKGFTQKERERILTEVIHNGIMSKADVIQYLNWFIKMNGRKAENISAKQKWESDLAFVRALDQNQQEMFSVSNVVPYKAKKRAKW